MDFYPGEHSFAISISSHLGTVSPANEEILFIDFFPKTKLSTISAIVFHAKDDIWLLLG